MDVLETSAQLSRAALLRRAALAGVAMSAASPLAEAKAFSAAAGGAGTISFWWWAEPDAPGADKWLSATAALYAKSHPGTTIQRDTQSTDTFISAFSAAAKARSGPDLASQWSGAYVLTQVLAGAVTPIQSLVPSAERAHWLNAWENQWNGQIWSMPLYLVGSPLIYNRKLFAKAGLDPDRPPTTWSGFLAACKKLKSSGTSPIVMGNKDGSAGLYFAANLRKQPLNSLKELSDAMTGKTSLLRPKQTAWLSRLNDLVENGFFNPDVASLELDEGRALFGQQQGAITWGTDGTVLEMQKTLGRDNIGVMKMPIYAHGKLAQGHNATQSTSFFVTSWTKNKQPGADFLVFLHQPAQLRSWYQATGVVPADKRFDASVIKDPVMRRLQQWNSQGPQVWSENFMPTQVVTDGDQAATGSLIAKQGNVTQAAKVIDAAARSWRTQQPKDAANYAKWVGGIHIPGL